MFHLEIQHILNYLERNIDSFVIFYILWFDNLVRCVPLRILRHENNCQVFSIWQMCEHRTKNIERPTTTLIHRFQKRYYQVMHWVLDGWCSRWLFSDVASKSLKSGSVVVENADVLCDKMSEKRRQNVNVLCCHRPRCSGSKIKKECKQLLSDFTQLLPSFVCACPFSIFSTV